MQIRRELKLIRELLSITKEDLSLILGVSQEIINRWEKKTSIEDNNIELIYN